MTSFENMPTCGGLNAANSVGYLCGHPEMIERGKGMLQRIGFTRDVLKEEINWIPGKETKPH